jgi:hypothetical protein
MFTGVFLGFKGGVDRDAGVDLEAAVGGDVDAELEELEQEKEVHHRREPGSARSLSSVIMALCAEWLGGWHCCWCRRGARLGLPRPPVRHPDRAPPRVGCFRLPRRGCGVDVADPGRRHGGPACAHGLRGHSMVYDSAHGRLIVVEGDYQSGDGWPPATDIWAFDTDTAEWIELLPAG